MNTLFLVASIVSLTDQESVEERVVSALSSGAYHAIYASAEKHLEIADNLLFVLKGTWISYHTITATAKPSGLGPQFPEPSLVTAVVKLAERNPEAALCAIEWSHSGGWSMYRTKAKSQRFVVAAKSDKAKLELSYWRMVDDKLGATANRLLSIEPKWGTTAWEYDWFSRGMLTLVKNKDKSFLKRLGEIARSRHKRLKDDTYWTFMAEKAVPSWEAVSAKWSG